MARITSPPTGTGRSPTVSTSDTNPEPCPELVRMETTEPTVSSNSDW
jgi:hypothetical protein